MAHTYPSDELMQVEQWKNRAPPVVITLCVTVESLHFLSTITTRVLMWEMNISSLTKNARQYVPSQTVEEVQPVKVSDGALAHHHH